MCGIVGIVSSSNVTERKWLGHAANALYHRGPDHAGEWWSRDNKAGFAHRRLSIIDLSFSANQPMHLNDMGLTIVFNGEIYNYRNLRNNLENLGYKFKTKSDTEVLLVSYSEWGKNCVNYLDGMFAFAIYDENRQTLFMARDRAGEKPLFYYYDNSTLYFSSELKALFKNDLLKKEIDLESLDCYLAMGFVPGGRCILSKYNKLAPANALFFDIKKKKLDIWNYWKIPDFEDQPENYNQDLLVNKLYKLLETSVQKQIVADVDVGLLLSGGIDSSLIAAFAAKYSNQIKTFTVRFPEYSEFDETNNARLIASHFNTKHNELVVSNDTNLADLLVKLVIQYDEPIVDSSIFPTYLICNLVSKHCKVALGGDGGDELFGGYNHYTKWINIERYLKYIPQSILESLANLSNKILPVGVKGHNFFESLRYGLNKNVPFTVSLFSKNIRSQLLGNKVHSYKNIAEEIHFGRISNYEDLIQRITRMDFENYLPEDILVKVDRASMLNSLEVRSPMLDFNIIDFTFRNIPSMYKVRTNNKKILLKKLASQILPSQFDKNRKQGFSIPLNQFLRKGKLRDLFWDTLLSHDSIFDHKVVKNILKGQDYGRSNSERLLALVQFELWKKNYKISL
jgi:asparagine synthase (glutamine-hydrolysing)